MMDFPITCNKIVTYDQNGLQQVSYVVSAAGTELEPLSETQVMELQKVLQQAVTSGKEVKHG